MYTECSYEDILKNIHNRAKRVSMCCKAQVGAEIYNPKYVAFGCNITMPGNCKREGCHRIKMYGDDAKSHRLPSDCYAIHAEVDAIATAARTGESLYGATIFVTRYPCEACARAIVSAGIKEVVYGGIEEISEQTKEIFDNYTVEVTYIPIAWGGDTIE